MSHALVLDHPPWDIVAIKRFYFLSGDLHTFDALGGKFADEFLSLQDFCFTGFSANAYEKLPMWLVMYF